MLRYTIVNVIIDYDLLREEIEPHAWCLNYIEYTSLFGDGVSFEILDTNQAEVEQYLRQNNIRFVKTMLKS